MLSVTIPRHDVVWESVLVVASPSGFIPPQTGILIFLPPTVAPARGICPVFVLTHNRNCSQFPRFGFPTSVFALTESVSPRKCGEEEVFPLFWPFWGSSILSFLFFLESFLYTNREVGICLNLTSSLFPRVSSMWGVGVGIQFSEISLLYS